MYGAETDVVRIFDDKLQLTDKEMFQYIKEADLENYGFTKTVEDSTETDENGRKTTKKTIYFRVTDDFSRVEHWEKVLEKRMPKEIRNSKIFSITVKEIRERIVARKTKSCTVGLEIHPHRCDQKRAKGNVSKRAAGKRCGWWSRCCLCSLCSRASIVFDN